VGLAAAADRFVVLVAAMAEAGLFETPSDNPQLTVFAPTEEAFEAAGISVDSVADRDEAILADVLTYHVTPGRRSASSVVNAPHVPTLNGQPIDVDATVLNDGQTEIVGTEIEASNGPIHVIDGVGLPDEPGEDPRPGRHGTETLRTAAGVAWRAAEVA